jgi:hypothetical protein
LAVVVVVTLAAELMMMVVAKTAVAVVVMMAATDFDGDLRHLHLARRIGCARRIVSDELRHGVGNWVQQIAV